jgi:hypothetical protein
LFEEFIRREQASGWFWFPCPFNPYKQMEAATRITLELIAAGGLSDTAVCEEGGEPSD